MKTLFNLKNSLFYNNKYFLQHMNIIRDKQFSIFSLASKSFLRSTATKNFSKNKIKINLFNLQTRSYSDWKRIEIPFDKIEMNFCRSSGPGGQNVNKLNTKVEYRFNVDTADWLPKETKERLRELNNNKINSEGFFILTCQEYRTQSQNKKEAQKKLQEIIDIASMPKKERIIIPFEETPQMEEKRIKEKKMRSDVKKMRNNRDY